MEYRYQGNDGGKHDDIVVKFDGESGEHELLNGLGATFLGGLNRSPELEEKFRFAIGELIRDDPALLTSVLATWRDKWGSGFRQFIEDEFDFET